MAARENHRKRKLDRDISQLDEEASCLSTESKLLQLVTQGKASDLVAVLNFIPKNHKGVVAALLKSAELGHKRIMQILIETGVSINKKNSSGNTALLIASQRGFVDLVKLLVRNGANVNCQNNDGETALILGVKQACSLPLIEFLISDESGANVNVQNCLGKTALMIAIEQQDFCAMKLLMFHKDTILGLKDENGMTALDIAKKVDLKELFGTFKVCRSRSAKPLIIAIKKKNVSLVQSVLYTLSQKEVNTCNSKGLSPLLVSLNVKFFNIEILYMLLKAGADVTMGSANDHVTPLYLACKAGSLEAVKILVKEGANVNSQTTFDKLTPLMYACQNNKIEIAKFLIKKKANINLKNRNCESALMLALKNCKSQTLVKLLIQNGAEINDTVFQLAISVGWYEMLHDINLVITRDLLNETFLLACQDGDIKLAKFLLENGAEVNIRSGESIPLVKALHNIKLVNLLISFGADVNLKDKLGSCPLVEAVYLNDCQVLETLIKQGADLNAVNSIGYTALMIAAKDEKLQALNLLLDSGADVNYLSNESGHLSALNAALNNDKTESVKLLLTRGALVHQTFNSPLLQSVIGNSKNMEMCLKYGAVPNIRSSDGSTVLMLALKTRCDFDKIKLLVDFGADIQMKNDKEENALILAAKYCTTKVIELLLKSGADITSEDIHGSSVLLCAVAHSVSNENKIALLINSGADVNQKNHQGDTPLILAAKCCHLNIVQLLVAKGASVNGQDEKGYTALMHAAAMGNYEKVKFFIECNVNLEIQNVNGFTAVMLAAYDQAHSEILKTVPVAAACSILQLLVDKGANVDAQDNNGFTALMYAVLGGSFQKVNTLIQCKASLDIQNFAGRAAVIIAANQDNAAILKALLEAGANANIADFNGQSALTVLLPHLYEWNRNHSPFDRLSCFKLVLAAGAKPDMQNIKNAILFHKLIVLCGDPDIIDLWIKNGAAPTVISFAVLRGLCSIPFRYMFTHDDEIVSPLLTAMFSMKHNLVYLFLKSWYLHLSDIRLSQKKSLLYDYFYIYKFCTCLTSGITTKVPFSLTCLSFLAVSSAVGSGLDRESRVNSLPIPAIMKNTLLFQIHKPCLSDNNVKRHILPV
uniref:Uncharacterized protein n=1 Tax=Biomphalaria glabrata TaxID=6526 RepID=A0A2C9JUP8_BIOGL